MIGLRQSLRVLRDKVGARDVFVFGGISLITVGAGMVYLPMAPIVAGLMLLVIGLIGIPRWN